MITPEFSKNVQTSFSVTSMCDTLDTAPEKVTVNEENKTYSYLKLFFKWFVV